MINFIYLKFKNNNDDYFIDLKDKFGFINVDWKKNLVLSRFFYNLMNSILLGKELPIIPTIKNNEIYRNYSISINFDNKYLYKLDVNEDQIVNEQLFRAQDRPLILVDTNRYYNFYIISDDGFNRGLEIDNAVLNNPEIPKLLFDFKNYFPHINCLYKDIIGWENLSCRQFTKLNKFIKSCFNEEIKYITIQESINKYIQVVRHDGYKISAKNMGSGFNCLINFFPNLIESVKNDILIPNINCSEIYSLHSLLVSKICTLLSKYRIQVFLDYPISGGITINF